MVMDAGTNLKVSIRNYVAQRIEEALEEDGRFKLPDLTDEIVEESLEDRHFTRAIVSEYLRPTIYQIATQLLKGTRSPGVRNGSGSILLGDEVMPEEEYVERLEDFRSRRIARWVEHAGDRYVRLMQMEKEDTSIAATEREKRGSTEYAIAGLLRHLGAHLTPGQRVEDVFTPEEVYDLYEQFKKGGES